MATFKCKMCGGSIEVIEGKSTCECEYCGSLQTVPLIYDNLKLNSLHNRANALRIKNEFDKALLTYETIISENSNDAEAHFGVVLCKYGIEYVDDAKTGKKIPTCHRTLQKSIFDDYDYLEAINHADVCAKALYEEEAKVIDEIQNNILSISINEQPYDIFICYKESDSNGERTIDSVLAQDIYDELTKIGYKVFFSRITLEDKIGREYEPIIYSALRSSKIMLVIGTSVENFNAVWVRNEWSRFLSFMSEFENKKFIIPCFKDIDAYELPDELLSYQSIDMSKLGFIQDLIRGINKLFGENSKANKKKINSEIAYNLDTVFKRVFMFLEDNDIEEARNKLDLILDNDPENVKAYLYLALLDNNVYSIDDLEKVSKPLLENKHFQKAYKYANIEERNELDSYVKIVNDNIRANECKHIYKEAISLFEMNKYSEALDKFNTINGYNDSIDYIDSCNEKINKLKEIKYQEGLALFENHKYKQSIEIFNSLENYKNSNELREDSIKLNEIDKLYRSFKYSFFTILNKQKKLDACIKEYEDNKENSRNLNIINEYKERKRFTNKIKEVTFVYGLILPIILLTLLIISISYIAPFAGYQQAMSYYKNYEYEQAQIMFEKQGDMGDSKMYSELMLGYEALRAGYYEDAIEYLTSINAVVNLKLNGNGGSVSPKEFQCYSVNDLAQVKPKANELTFLRWEIADYSIEFKYGMVYAYITLKAVWLEQYMTLAGYVDIGTFPRSRVGDSDLIEKLNNLYGDKPDGYYFYKTYKYYKYTVNVPQGSKYHNGNEIFNGTTWFRVEPITWVRLENKDGLVTLATYQSIVNLQFDNDTALYLQSDIRDFLMNELYEECFLQSEKDILVSNKYIDNSENNKIWLFSSEEVDSDEVFSKGQFKRVTLTDFCYATGGQYNITHLSGTWWLRDNNIYNPMIVNPDISLSYTYYGYYSLVRPGIYLNVHEKSYLVYTKEILENPKKSITR